MLTLIDDFGTYGNISPESSNVYLSWPPWVNLAAPTSEFMKIYAPGLGLHASTAIRDHHHIGYETDVIMLEVTKYHIN